VQNAVQGKAQNAMFGKQETTSASEHHGQAMVAATPVATMISPGCFDFFTAFHFPCGFSDVQAAILPLKGMNLAVKKRRFHTLAYFFPHFNSIEEIGRRRSKGKQRQRIWMRVERSSIQC